MKIGFETFVMRKAYRNPLYNIINWHGKTLSEVMCLDKVELRDLLSRDKPDSPHLLRAYHWFKKKGVRLSFDDSNRLNSFPTKEAQEALKRISASPLEASKYVLKQMQRPGSNRIYSSDMQVLKDWEDYLTDCLQLEMDLQSSAVKYPNNLHAAHQKTMKKVKFKEDKELNEKVKGLYLTLKKQYSYETNNFIVRPIRDTAEIFTEAKALSHCVGGYVKQHAAGQVVILVVRRKEEPDKPFYTVEIAGQTVRQCRGYKNCAMTDDVSQFISMFAKARLKKRPNKNMRGVAV
jgi:hypothetical protein